MPCDQPNRRRENESPNSLIALDVRSFVKLPPVLSHHAFVAQVSRFSCYLQRKGARRRPFAICSMTLLTALLSDLLKRIPVNSDHMVHQDPDMLVFMKSLI